MGSGMIRTRMPQKARLGEANPNAQLTESDVREMRESAGRGVSLERLAQEFDVSPQNCWLVVSGRAWKHLTEEG